MSSANDFRKAVESKDVDGMLACLAADVVFHSPVTFKPFLGRDAVKVLFGILIETFEDFRYTDEMEGAGVHALIFKTRVGDKEVEGIDILRPGDDGLIADFTVMVRPLSAAHALRDTIGARLGAQ